MESDDSRESPDLPPRPTRRSFQAPPRVVAAVQELLSRCAPSSAARSALDAEIATRSEFGKWNYRDVGQFSYGDDTTYKKGIGFLDGHGTIEDWGCGTAYASRFVRRSAYVGIDGAESRFADKLVDLRDYRSNVECIFMRHVLEHNSDWQRILANAIDSFTKRFALIIFTPFLDETHQIASWKGKPQISFRKDDLIQFLRPFQCREESLVTGTVYNFEHIFYVTKRGHRGSGV